MCLRFRVSFVRSENQKYHGKRKTIITKQNISKQNQELQKFRSLIPISLNPDLKMNSRNICCVVPKCQKYLNPGVTVMYKFPTNEIRRRIWADQIARSNWTPTNDSLICEIHFEESEFEGKRKLRDDAVPTIFLHFDTVEKNSMDTEDFLLVDTADSCKIKNVNDDLQQNETKTSPKHTTELIPVTSRFSPKYTTEFIPSTSRFIHKGSKVEVTNKVENILQETQNFPTENAEMHEVYSNRPTNISVETKPVNKYVNLNAKRKNTLTNDMYRKELERVDNSTAKKPKMTEPSTKFGFLSIDELSKKLKEKHGKELPKKLKQFHQEKLEISKKSVSIPKVMDEFENTSQETQNFININSEVRDDDEDSNPPSDITDETMPVNKYVNLNDKRKSTTTKDMYRKELEKEDILVDGKPKTALTLHDDPPSRSKMKEVELLGSKKVYSKLDQYINISTQDFKKNLEDSLTHIGAEIDLPSIDRETHSLFLEKRDLIKRVEKLEKHNQELKDMLIAKEENHIAQLQKFLNKDQINHIRRGTKLTKKAAVKWSDETYEAARNLVLYCGWSGYKEILKAKFPFPNIRSLQRVYVGQSWKLKKDYKCDICEKKGKKREFFKAANLQLHITRIHEGKRDHQCTYCGMMFCTPMNLRNHVFR